MAESSSEEKEIQLCEFNIRTIEVKKNNVREVWASSLDFFLSALGYAGQPLKKFNFKISSFINNSLCCSWNRKCLAVSLHVL